MKAIVKLVIHRVGKKNILRQLDMTYLSEAGNRQSSPSPAFIRIYSKSSFENRKLPGLHTGNNSTYKPA